MSQNIACFILTYIGHNYNDNPIRAKYEFLKLITSKQRLCMLIYHFAYQKHICTSTSLITNLPKELDKTNTR